MVPIIVTMSTSISMKYCFVSYIRVSHLQKPITSIYDLRMAALKLYFDPMSQPSRAVLLFLKANSIPFIEKQITLRKGKL